jgi:mRNA interferase MazF
MYTPKRGDFIWVVFDPKVGHEQAGRGPAIVLSSIAYNNALGFAVVCPATTKKKNYPFEVDISDGLPITGVVLADQIKNIDWAARGAEFICEAPIDFMERLATILRLLLGF